MLYELYVENFALIKRMRLPLQEGVNALTGETGAGKSLLVDALGLLIGGRGNDGLIRSGDERCVIEGLFVPPLPAALSELADEEGNILLSRELVRGGRSVARINGRVTPLTRLKEVGQQLVNIHGQHEYTQLLQEDRQLTLLDGFGGAELQAALGCVEAAFDQWRQAERQLEDYQQHQAERKARLEQLKFMLDELEQAAPQPDEDIQLEQESHLLAHGEKLYQWSDACYTALADDGAVERLNSALTQLRQAAALDDKLSELYQRLESAYYEAEDIAAETAAYRDRVDLDAFRLEAVESRIALLSRLKKKYGGTMQALLLQQQQAQAEYRQLEEVDISGDIYREQAEAAQAEYQQQAAALTQQRQLAAQRLSQAISDELHKLCMEAAQFRIDLPQAAPSRLGNERACFMILTNVGEDYQPVNKIASGGELSRIVLGIKVILAQLDQIPVLIFDEVDTGLSGRALNAVAERLALVGRYAQTIIVSHSAVMAATAGHQILIEKHQQQQRTVIEAHSLEGEQRIQELARMIAGDKAGEVTLRQAEEMLGRAEMGGE